MEIVDGDSGLGMPVGLRPFESGACADGVAAYRVDEVLKRGAAEMTAVAYLPLPNGGEAGPFVLKRLHREARAGAAYTTLLRSERAGIRHRHLPRIFSVTEAGEETHVIMELVPGETLATLVRRVGSSTDLARTLMPLVCEGASELHEGFSAPIIHRDLKPSNIMVDGWEVGDDASGSAGFPRATIIDLGIARSWHAGGQSDTTHLGTRGYAPPEQFGFGQTDVRSDVYALGALLVFCCTGEEPSPVRTVPDLVAIGMPEPLAAVAVKAMSFDPADRYASAAELADAIRAATQRGEAATAGTPVETSPVAKAGQSPSPREALVPLLARASTVLGVIWNLALLAMAAILVAASCWSVVEPGGSLVRLDPFSRALAALLVLGAPGAAILWHLFDKRRLIRRFPAIGRWTWKRCTLLSIKTLGACFLGMVVLVIVQMLPGLS